MAVERNGLVILRCLSCRVEVEAPEGHSNLAWFESEHDDCPRPKREGTEVAQ